MNYRDSKHIERQMKNEVIDEMYALKTRLSIRLQETDFQDKEARMQYDDLQVFLDAYEQNQLTDIEKKSRELMHNINEFFNKLEELK